MIPNEIREKAYNEIDALLHRLERGPLAEIAIYQSTNRPAHSYIVSEILKAYDLVENKISQNVMFGTEKFLTMNGIRALTAGGIREYIIDTDPAIVLHGGYPMVVSVIKESGSSKHLISSALEYADLMEHFENEDVHYNTRTSHRSNGQVFMQVEKPTSLTPQPAPTVNNHWHVEGNVNTFNTTTGDVNQNVNLGYQSAANIGRPATPEIASNGWKWTERYSWIAGILAAIVAVITIWYEIFKDSANH